MSVEKMSTRVVYCNAFPVSLISQGRGARVGINRPLVLVTYATELTGCQSAHLFEIKRVENTRPVNSGTVRLHVANVGLPLIPTSGRDWQGMQPGSMETRRKSSTDRSGWQTVGEEWAGFHMVRKHMEPREHTRAVAQQLHGAPVKSHNPPSSLYLCDQARVFTVRCHGDHAIVCISHKRSDHRLMQLTD